MAASKHRKRILRELAANPAWKVYAGAAWLCPYCGEPVARELLDGEAADDAAVERALEHFEVCRSWREFEGRTLPIAELDSRAQALRLREALRRSLISNPAWQLYDVARRWYCPYCAQATQVAVPEGGRIGSSALREIERHLATCFGYAKGRGAEKPLAYLKSMVAYANRTRKMAEQIRRKIESDAQWRLRDAEQRWVCPYCRRVVEHIDFSSPLQMLETAPLEIAKHLVSNCERFRSAQKEHEGRLAQQSSATLEIARLGAAATTDLVRLSGVPPAAVSGEFRAIGPPATPPAGAAAPGLGRPPRAVGAASAREWRESIRTTLSEVRSQVPLERDEPAPAEPTALAAASPASAAPEVEGLEVRSFFRAARPSPCDFADVTPLESGGAVVAVGSVSGEGAEAGLALPMVRNLLRVHGRGGRAPVEVLRAVNEGLFAEFEGRTFVALLFGVLDLRALTYRFARAGTAAPLLWRPPQPGPRRRPAPDGVLEALESPGLVLGVDRGAAFEASLAEREVRLAPGDLLVHFTHGAIAAEDFDGRDLSLPRLQDLVQRYGNHEADYFIHKFGQVFEDWTRGAPLADDACVLAIKVKETS